MTSPYKSQSQNHFNKNSAQRGRDDSLSGSQQNKYYQSRYIYQQSPAESAQALQTPFQKRSGQKSIQQQSQVLPPKATQIEPQQQQFDLKDQQILQTPLQSQYTHTRNRSDYNQNNQPNQMDMQIDLLIEQLLSDDIILQSLNSQYRTPGDDKLRTGNKLRDAVGLVLQQFSGGRESFQSQNTNQQYQQLKNEYVKLQQEFSRKVSEQAERIQLLSNQVVEKEEMFIRESKTRQMLENQNQDYCKKINELTGDYHNKLQMKEEVFYQKGQECYNEINVLKRTIVELQQKIAESEQYMQHQEAEILKIQDKSQYMIEEKDGMLSQIKNEAVQVRKNLEKTEIHNSGLNQQLEELRQQLQQLDISKQGVENNLRVVIEEKKKEQESYELLLKQKEAEKCLEANDLISALNHLRDERIEDNCKHKQWISVIQNQMKQLNQKKYDLMQQLYNQKNQWQSLVNTIINKMLDQIKSNANWYKKILKDKDTVMMKFKREKDKEIDDLNQRWQDVVDQQDKTLHNEFQTELLNQSGKFEQQIGILQGQVNDFNGNYMQIREHKEIIQLKEAKFTEERDRLLKMVGELENIGEDLEWKLQTSEKEAELSNGELSKEIQNKCEIQQKFNACEKQRQGLDARLRNQEFLNEKLRCDVQELVQSLEEQIGKNEKNLDIKKKLEEQLLIRRKEIQGLDEEILQRKFQIQQDSNLINKRELELEQKDREIKEKENEIIGLKRVIDEQDARIRTMELNERDDLNEYHKNSQANSNEIECLWKAKKELWRDLQDNDYEHLKGYEKLSNQKKKVVEDLFAVTWQLRQRDRELKNEQRMVESLLANKKKLNQIIEDLNSKIDDLNNKIEELQLNLNNTKEEKNKIIQKFKEFKLSQLKQKKFQLLQTKKFMQNLQNEYMQFGYSINQQIKQSNSDLQKFIVEIAAKLQESATQHEDELNNLRTSLTDQHQQDLNNQLNNERERSRVQLDTAKQQMGAQIISLNEQLKVLKKKLSNTGQNNNQLDQELFQSQNVMRFADQEIFDVRQRYKTIQGQLSTIVLEIKGKYETIEQDHSNTVYSKQQIQQLKLFTDLQNLLSELIRQLEELLKKYNQMDQQKEKDLKNSQAALQSKLLTSSRMLQLKSPKKDQSQFQVQPELVESFSPTHYQKRREQEIQQEGRIQKINANLAYLRHF